LIHLKAFPNHDLNIYRARKNRHEQSLQANNGVAVERVYASNLRKLMLKPSIGAGSRGESAIRGLPETTKPLAGPCRYTGGGVHSDASGLDYESNRQFRCHVPYSAFTDCRHCTLTHPGRIRQVQALCGSSLPSLERWDGTQPGTSG